ncbi:MAG: hypothetical protein WD042_06470 [Phycisphaeraceae bacterium]
MIRLRHVVSLAMPLMLAAPLHAAPVKIMPLGDSITHGDAGHVSYRYWLWQTLQRGGYDVDLSGQKTGADLCFAPVLVFPL